MTIQKAIIKKDGKLDIKAMRERDARICKGIFRFHEVPGGQMSFSFKAYKDDPVERYDMVDGQVYSVPFGVAKHLNSNCKYPEYSYIKGETMAGGFSPDGSVMKVTKDVRRCSFQSLEFIDDADMTPKSDIVSVETIGK